jgi:hypothetical protein
MRRQRRRSVRLTPILRQGILRPGHSGSSIWRAAQEGSRPDGCSSTIRRAISPSIWIARGVQARSTPTPAIRLLAGERACATSRAYGSRSFQSLRRSACWGSGCCRCSGFDRVSASSGRQTHNPGRWSVATGVMDSRHTHRLHDQRWPRPAVVAGRGDRHQFRRWISVEKPPRERPRAKSLVLNPPARCTTVCPDDEALDHLQSAAPTPRGGTRSLTRAWKIADLTGLAADSMTCPRRGQVITRQATVIARFSCTLQLMRRLNRDLVSNLSGRAGPALSGSRSTSPASSDAFPASARRELKAPNQHCQVQRPRRQQCRHSASAGHASGQGRGDAGADPGGAGDRLGRSGRRGVWRSEVAALEPVHR